MSKVIINNEIIILRKFVDQARVHTIKKLTRDVTKYRNKKGTDAQKAKNERKSTRLTAEVLAIKKIKKDEITKNILKSNFNDLKEVLENQTSSPLDRAIARIAHHKIFSKKVEEFKNKYPNYMEFMGPSRKKKAISEWKEKKKVINSESIEKVETKDKDEIEISCLNELEGKVETIGKLIDSTSIDKENNEEKVNKVLRKRKIKELNEKFNKTSSTSKMKILEKSGAIDLECGNSEILDEKRTNDNKSDRIIQKQSNLEKKNNDPKIISKQAIVKKLTDILQEDMEVPSKVYDKEINSKSTVSNLPIKKEVDSFFITSDEKSYLSIAISKDKDWDVEDDDNYYKGKNYNKRKFSSQQNGKFFSKVSKFQKNSSKLMPQWKDKNEYSKPKETNTLKLEKKRNEKISSKSHDKEAMFVKNKKSILDNKGFTYLHPSWEAKRKEQEMLKKGFKGKKIIFGDEM